MFIIYIVCILAFKYKIIYIMAKKKGTMAKKSKVPTHAKFNAKINRNKR
jgi:hypothetical protein